MFSQREREFLRLLADGSSAEALRQLQEQFPNPVYRRRLFWGIRRKAMDAARDWELYVQAARLEGRVVRPLSTEAPSSVPIYTEPFAALAKRLGGLVRARPSRRSRTAPRTVP